MPFAWIGVAAAVAGAAYLYSNMQKHGKHGKDDKGNKQHGKR